MYPPQSTLKYFTDVSFPQGIKLLVYDDNSKERVKVTKLQITESRMYSNNTNTTDCQLLQNAT